MGLLNKKSNTDKPDGTKEDSLRPGADCVLLWNENPYIWD